MQGTPFLKSVADDLVKKIGTDFSNVTVVFPNNRAQLFFNRYLLDAVGGKPFWSSVITIEQLFSSLSEFRIADPIKLVCQLFDVYKQVLEKHKDQASEEKEETLDTFFNWGRVLLSDFEDVDGNMVDAEGLFQNIKDTVPFEADNSHLTDEQRKVIERFFEVFKENDTELKRRFLRLWSLLGEVYSEFRKKLEAAGEVYGGMMKRSVVENLKNEKVNLPERTYVFVGFNVLVESEKQLFRRLKKAGNALFYWDCDAFYMNLPEAKQREAGLFMRDNAAEFPNELPTVDLLKQKKEISIIGSPTENAQARYVEDFLKNKNYSDTVVVLCNEALLLPVLHSIPSEEGNNKQYVNVTMGLPVAQTPIFGMVQLLLAYQERLLLREVKPGSSLQASSILPLLRNEYLREAYDFSDLNEEIVNGKKRFFKYDDLAAQGDLFKRCDSSVDLLKWLVEVVGRVAALFNSEDKGESGKENNTALYDNLYRETIYRIYTTLNRLLSLSEDDKVLDVELPTMIQLVSTSLSSISVPFTGDEADGLQVMGFLETRNLDFSNVILLSANEGMLPNSGKENTFIPYSLRKGFGMTTVEHKNSLYAYYFYRLLQRADNVSILYSIPTDGAQKGQMSRFVLQMLVELGYPVNRYQIKSDVPKQNIVSLEVEKTDEIKQKMDEFKSAAGKKQLTPSAMNTYLDCPLKFYLKFVLKVAKPEELSDDVKTNEFGTIFHRSMELFYDGMEGKMINESYFDDPKCSKAGIEKIVEQAFNEKYYKNDGKPMPEMSGLQMLNRDAIVRFVEKMVSCDKAYAPFKILNLEKEVRWPFPVERSDGSTINIALGGTIDRVDEKDGKIRILDYKTGGKNDPISSVEDFFFLDEENRGKKGHRHHYGFQVMLYALLYSKLHGDCDVFPALAFITRANGNEDFLLVQKEEKEKKPIDSAKAYFKEFEEKLQELISEMFNPAKPFSSVRDGDGCKYCDFLSYCKVTPQKY